MNLLQLLTNPSNFMSCLAAGGTGGALSCLDVGGVIGLSLTLPAKTAPFTVQTTTNCTMCSVATGFRPSCRSTLDSIVTDIAAGRDGGACSAQYIDQVRPLAVVFALLAVFLHSDSHKLFSSPF